MSFLSQLWSQRRPRRRTPPPAEAGRVVYEGALSMGGRAVIRAMNDGAWYSACLYGRDGGLRYTAPWPRASQALQWCFARWSAHVARVARCN